MNTSGWLRSRLFLLSCAIAVGIGTVVMLQLLESRSATWRRAQTANTDLLFTVSHVLDRTLENADRAIQHSVSVLETVASSTLWGARSAPSGEPALQGAAATGLFYDVDVNLLFAAVSSSGYGIQLVLDDQGRVLFASRPPPAPHQVFNERAYFKVHQQSGDAGFYMGSPFISSYDGQPSMAMSRRWNLPDGSFGGVVVQTMKLSVIQNLFSSFQLGPDSGINLFLTDGTVVTRFPYTHDYIGTSVANEPNFKRFLSEEAGGFTAITSGDQVERMHLFRRLTDFPLIVNVAQATHSILGGWQRNAAWLGGATLLLMLACIGLAVFAEKELRAHRQTARRLRHAEHDLRTIIDSLPVMVAYWDNRLINRMSNAAHRHWLGLLPHEIQGQHFDDVLSAKLRNFVRPYVDATLAGRPQTFEHVFPDINATPRHAVTSLIPDWEQGVVKGFFVMVTDISERKAAEMALFEEKERFRVILDSINDGVITTNHEGRILYVNPAAAALTGWGPDEAEGLPMETVMRIESPRGGPVEVCPLRMALTTRKAPKTKVEHVLVGRQGERVHIENSVAPILDEQGELRGAVIVFHEIGDVLAMASKMTHLAQHDALTGLPNRRRLDQVAQHVLTVAHTQNRYMAVLYLDLDGFKQVNDQHGHAVGDELLVAVTRRLAGCLRATDGLYRQGGDEFVVLMAELAAPEEADQLAARLIECCRNSWRVSGKELSVTVSIGIGVFPDDASELGVLIQRADRAMYAAKQAGRNRYARVVNRPITGEQAAVEAPESLSVENA